MRHGGHFRRRELCAAKNRCRLQRHGLVLLDAVACVQMLWACRSCSQHAHTVHCHAFPFLQWRERNGESQLQLLILALLDKEHEMPGTSWRVRVKPPPSAAVPSSLPAIAGAAAAPGSSGKKSASKSACLQVGVVRSVASERDPLTFGQILQFSWHAWCVFDNMPHVRMPSYSLD